MKKLLMVLALCSGSYAMAQNDNKTLGVMTDPASFIKKAAMINDKEIKAGKMAQEKAMNPQVRSYGEMMVTHHTASSDELNTLASRKNITLPGTKARNAGAASSAYMGSKGQSSYSGTSSANRSTGTISERSYRGTADMRLSKAQTTPDKKYYEGTPTNWTDKHVNKNSQTSSVNRMETNKTTLNSTEGISGQNMTTATGNANMNTDWNNANSSTTTSISTELSTEEPGVSPSGNLGVSGTTGTLNTNAAFNGAQKERESIAVGTSTSSQNMATGTATTISDTRNDMMIDGQDKLNMLGEKSGAEFDRAYLEMMVTDHSKAIELYENASKSADTDVSGFATKMLPSLREHHDKAKSLQSTVNTSQSGL
jgi:predicted outer membrane protein